MINDLVEKLRKLNVTIKLVDERLDIEAPKGVLSTELVDEIKLRKEDLIRFIASGKVGLGAEINSLHGAAQAGYPLSHAQKRFWTLSQLPGRSIAYNMCGALRFTGELDTLLLEEALRAVAVRHESLRTYFKEAGGNVSQQILPAEKLRLPLQYSDLEGLGNAGERAESCFLQEQRTPFNLEEGPLFRIRLLRTAANEWIMVYAMHHIIGDGISMKILVHEMLSAYGSLASAKHHGLPPAKMQYRDFTAWHNRLLQSEEMKQHGDFWLQHLEGPLPLLDLGHLRARPAVKTYNGDMARRQLPAVLAGALKNYCTANGSTLFMGLLAAFNALAYRYSGLEDVVIGTPMAGRDHADLEDQIGPYLNTLVMRTRFGKSDSFERLLQKTRDVVIQAYRHRQLPFDVLLEKLAPAPDVSRSPLFDVMLVLQSAYSSGSYEQAGVTVSPFEFGGKTTSQFDLTLEFREVGDALEVLANYNTDVYPGFFIYQLLGHYIQLLEALLNDPAKEIGRADYLGGAEKHILLEELNDTAIAFPANESLADLFSIQAQKTPGAPAIVVAGGRRLSYSELDEESERFAAWLQKEHKVKPGSTIALSLERNEMLVVAILAILKSGCAYVPVEPSYPPARQQHILGDCGCALLIDDAALAHYHKRRQALLPGMATRAGNASGLAYIMYTSGSTGRPKGVMVRQHSVVRLVKGTSFTDLSSSTVFLATGSVSFDAFTLELWGPLLNGGQLVLCSHDRLMEPSGLAALIRSNGVNTMWFTSSWFNQLVDSGIDFTSALKTVIVGGDKLSVPHINKIREHSPSLRMVNGYGPTENTTFSTTFDITGLQKDAVPIGRPIANSLAYVLDGDMQLLPFNVAGELYVGGSGLAAGYQGDAVLTGQKFVPGPFKSGGLLYRTGDICKMLPDGNIVYIGRADSQVKIRGYRVETTEVESCLLGIPGINDCRVLVHNSEAGKSLAAYFVAQEPVEVSWLLAELRRTLPDYMLPAYFVQLGKLPLTANGKLDVKALPGVDASHSVRAAYEAPQNDTEEKLAKIWERILGKVQVSALDSFFELGGHSLKIGQLIFEAENALGTTLRYHDVFTNPVLRDLAGVLRKRSGIRIPAAATLPGSAPVLEHYPANVNQKRLWQFYRLKSSYTEFNMHYCFRLPGTLSLTQLEEAINFMLRRQEAFRTHFIETPQGLQFSIVENYYYKTELHDLLHLAAPEREARRAELLRQSSATPFRLEEFPLFRLAVIRSGEDLYELAFTVHHIIFDGKSLEIVYREFSQVCQSLAMHGRIEGIEPRLPLQYKDFAWWLDNYINSAEASAEMRSYWAGQLQGFDVSQGLKYDMPPPPQVMKECFIYRTYIDEGLKKNIDAYLSKQKVSYFNLVLACYYCAIAKHSHKSDVIIGSPGISRPFPGLDLVSGFFANSLIFRIRSAPGMMFGALLEEVKAGIAETLERQYYPLENVCGTIGREWTELLKVWLNLSILDIPTSDEGTVPDDSHTEKVHTHTVDIATYINTFSNRIELTTYYSIHAFKKQTIETILGDFKRSLQLATAGADIPLSTLIHHHP